MRHPRAVEAVAGLAPLVGGDRSSARSRHLGSRRFGMNALMPPIACAPRLWHVCTSSSV
jgi:hypothetical protein